MIKCLIFDCDGTLVDSELLCNEGLVIKLKEYGINEDAQTLLERYRGGKLANIVKDLEERHQQTFSDDFIVSYRQVVSDLFNAELQPVQGVEVALEALDLPKCVASNGPLHKMQEALIITGLAHHFSGNLFSAYEAKSWKPDPGLFLHVAKAMGFKPEECAVIEDSVVGIEAALAANMKPIYYNHLGDEHSNEQVESITRMSQLTHVLSGKVVRAES